MNLRTLLLAPSLSVGWFALAAMAALTAHADDYGTIGTDVVMDFSPAGRKLRLPSAEHPTYYLPLSVGYVEKGEVLNHFQHAKPNPAQVEQLVVRMLAEQHYLLAPKTIRPDLVLTLKWGYKAPQYVNVPGGRKVMTNEAEMKELVGGTLVDLSPANTGVGASDLRNQGLTDLFRQARWYIEITAMDFNDWRGHKITLLWRATTSADLWGHYLDEVLPTLIAASGPYVGRPMDRPMVASVPLNVPPGSVTVGKPVVVPNSGK